MPSRLERVELKNGIAYQLDDPWPGAPKAADPDDQLRVGPIFYRSTETTTVPTESDEDPCEKCGQVEGDGGSATDETPAHYEIWRVTNRLIVVLRRLLRGEKVGEQELGAALVNGQIARRVVYVDSVAIAEDVWEPSSAFRKLVDRLSERADEETEESEPANGGQQQAQAAPG